MEPLDSATRFDSSIPLARRLYAEGKTHHDVMRAVYGVDLPAEAYAFWTAFISSELETQIELMTFPWNLIIAQKPGFRHYWDGWEREQEERAFAQVPRFLPLMMLRGDEALHHDCIIGYDLDELSAGRTTILGHHDDFPETGAELERLGSSLLDVLHEWMTSYLQQRNEELHSPRNFGFGSIEQKDVDRDAAMLRAIEAARHEV